MSPWLASAWWRGTVQGPVDPVIRSGPADGRPRGNRTAGTTRPLTFTRDGAGTLFYNARLRYASDSLFQQGLDNGVHIERTFAPYVETGTRPAQTTFKAGT